MTGIATPRLWPPGSSTGLGSLPGTDPVEAARLVLGEVPGLPYLPELADRGLGADLIGRTASLLVDLPVEWQPHGWTMASHSTRDIGRARDWLQWDLDAFTELAQGVPVVKVSVCGPLTLAASMELPNLHKVLTDHGAVADLVTSLAEGVTLHLAELHRRLPGTEVVLQLDEPGLPSVLAGRVPTPSGYGTVRSVDEARARAALTEVLAAAGPAHRVIHCCAPDVPFELIRSAGAAAIAFDFSLVRRSGIDVLGELIEAGTALILGLIPGTDTPLSADAVRDRVNTFWSMLGFPREQLAGAVLVSPACGLAGASMAYVRSSMALLRAVGESTLE